MRRTNKDLLRRLETGMNGHRGAGSARTCQRLSAEGMIQFKANRGIAQSGFFASRGFQSNEFVPGAYCFRRQIAPVVGIDWGLERNAGGDLDAGFCYTV